MATVRHLGRLKRIWTFPRVVGPHFFYPFGEHILIGGGNMPPKLHSKQFPLAVKFYFRFKSPHVSSYATFMCVIIQSFSQMTDDIYAPVTMTWKRQKWQNRVFDRESNGRF